MLSYAVLVPFYSLKTRHYGHYVGLTSQYQLPWVTSRSVASGHRKSQEQRGRCSAGRCHVTERGSHVTGDSIPDEQLWDLTIRSIFSLFFSHFFMSFCFDLPFFQITFLSYSFLSVFLFSLSIKMKQKTLVTPVIQPDFISLTLQQLQYKEREDIFIYTQYVRGHPGALLHAQRWWGTLEVLYAFQWNMQQSTLDSFTNGPACLHATHYKTTIHTCSSLYFHSKRGRVFKWGYPEIWDRFV